MAFGKKAKKAPETFHFEEMGGAMPMADAMRRQAQDIVNSFDARMARVRALRDETAVMLKRFQHDLRQKAADLRQKAADLKRFLSNAETSRMRDFRAMHQDIRARQEERNRGVAGTLDGFRRENEAAASHWHSIAATMAKRRAAATR